MMMYGKDYDISFQFESLGRAAFNNCSKGGDPYGFARQDVYTHFIEPIKIRGRRALACFLQKIINDHYDYQTDVQVFEIEDLIRLEKRTWEVQTQDEIIEIIQQSIVHAENLGY